MKEKIWSGDLVRVLTPYGGRQGMIGRFECDKVLIDSGYVVFSKSEMDKHPELQSNRVFYRKTLLEKI